MSPLVAAASYPPARRSPDGGDLAGTYVADPFRWLEDADAEETRTFVDAQNNLARSVLDCIDARDADPRVAERSVDLSASGSPVLARRSLVSIS